MMLEIKQYMVYLFELIIFKNPASSSEFSRMVHQAFLLCEMHKPLKYFKIFLNYDFSARKNVVTMLNTLLRQCFDKDFIDPN